MTLLNLVLALPLAGFFVILFVPRDKPHVVRAVAIAVALMTFLASIGLALRCFSLRKLLD